MIIIPMTNVEEVQKVAQRILEKAVENPETRAVIERLIQDDKEANRRTLFCTAFAMGAGSALAEMMQGHVVQVGSEPESYSDC
jgi:uncharacterized membrane protein YjjP (DUF1212 family)